MGWLIFLGVLVLLGCLPLGVRLNFDEGGFRAAVLIGRIPVQGCRTPEPGATGGRYPAIPPLCPAGSGAFGGFPPEAPGEFPPAAADPGRGGPL